MRFRQWLLRRHAAPVRPTNAYCPIPRRRRWRPPASPSGALIGFDDSPNERVANNVGGREADGGDALDPVELLDRIGEARLAWIRQIDLVRVAADHHPAAHSEAGQEH